MSQIEHSAPPASTAPTEELDPIEPIGSAPATAAPSGWRDRVLGLRGVVAVALASVIVGGAGGLVLGRLGNNADDTRTGPGGQFGPFQPGQNGFPGQIAPGQHAVPRQPAPGQNAVPGQPAPGQNAVPGQNPPGQGNLPGTAG